MQTFSGRSNCRGFSAGSTFTLKGLPIKTIDNTTYVLTRVRHDARQHLTSGSDEDRYGNQFVCLSRAIAFRPPRNHPKPMIGGSQVAIVTGPKQEEIHTDKYGRVKVRFFWDRRSDQQGDGNMSCWIRVSQAWAGAKYGALYLPRVGQEVIVSFLDGDPDRPIITGRVYNSKNQPPYDLPAEKTKSTIRTSSTKQGRGNFNEIRFEDLTGSEELFTHAAKDQNEIVQNDMSTQVKNNQRIEVHNNRALTVIDGNEEITIQSGGRKVSVQGNETHTNAADFTQKVSGDLKLKVNGNISIDASGLVTINGAKIILNG
jgi:type VI secretion system secreted protein VgrG